jgi:hypothetical protein
MLHRAHWATWLAIVCGCLLPPTAAQAGDAVAPADWGYSADGSHVLHLSARTVWSRCVEGMRWDGQRCVGEALQLDLAGALAWARKRAETDGLAWRLPQVKELQHLLEVNAHASPGTTAGFLPEPPPGWCWTGTAPVDTRSFNEYQYGNVMRGLTAQNAAQVRFLHGWAVDLATGEARDDALKRSRLLVRLVAPLD